MPEELIETTLPEELIFYALFQKFISPHIHLLQATLPDQEQQINGLQIDLLTVAQCIALADKPVIDKFVRYMRCFNDLLNPMG